MKMINSVREKIRINKFVDMFKKDKFGSILFLITFLVVSLTLITLPIFTYHEGYTSITNILSICSIALILIFLIFRGRFNINYYVVFMVCFVLYSLIITLLTTKEFTYMKTLLTTHAFTVILFLFFSNYKDYKAFFYLILASFILYSAVFIVQYLPDIIRSHNYFGRLGEVLGNVNGVGFTFNTACVFTLSIIYKKRGKYFYLLIPTFIFVFCILLTGSRGAYFSAAIIFIVFIYLLIGEKHKITFFTLTLSIVGIFFLVIQLPIFEAFRNRFYSMFASLFTLGNSKQSDGSSVTRMNMFVDGIKLWMKNLFFGYGVGGFKANTAYPYYSHNTISEVLVNTGIIGAVLFAFPFIKSLRLNRKVQTSNDSFHGFIVLLTSLTTVALFFDIIYYTKISIISWCVVAAFVYSKTYAYQNRICVSFFNDKKFKFECKYIRGEKIEKKETKKEVVKPNIAFVITQLSGGGAERVASLLCSEWSKNYNVTMILTSKAIDKPKYKIGDNVNLVSLSPNKKISFVIKIFKIRSIFKKVKPNICVTFISSSFLLAKIGGLFLGIKHIFSLRIDPSISEGNQMLRNFAYRNSDCIVCQTKEIDDYFNKRKYTKSLIIKNPLSEGFSVSKKCNKNIIIAVGRLEKQKRFDLLINAFNEVYKNNKSISLKIYGFGSEEEYLNTIITENNLQNVISICPYTDKIKTAFENSGIYCCTSSIEGMSNSMLEAAAIGLPIVSTDCSGGCAREIVQNGYNGIIVEKNPSIEDYASALNEVVNNYHNFRENSIRYSEVINNELNLSKISAEWVNLFIYILN